MRLYSMSVLHLLGSQGSPNGDAIARRQLRKQLALRQEIEARDNDEWNEAFRAFTDARDEQGDGRHSLAVVL